MIHMSVALFIGDEIIDDAIAWEKGHAISEAHAYSAWARMNSVNEAFLPIGKCCYCGYEHELVVCARCGAVVTELEHGLCPSCSAYVDKQ